MRIVKNLSALFLIISFFGCLSPETDDLGNNYFLAYGQDGLLLGKRMPGIPTYKEYTIIIQSRILSYAFDSTFVIAMQKEWDSIPEIKSQPDLDGMKRAFEKSNFRQYFILNKPADKLYGPYKEDSFLTKRKVLRVPDKLKIE
jgi:hypothetical protein